MTAPTRAQTPERPAAAKPPMMQPRADGPTRINRGPRVVGRANDGTPKTTRKATRPNEFPPRVEFDNYKASYLRM
jgi:hypothetical protein